MGQSSMISVCFALPGQRSLSQEVWLSWLLRGCSLGCPRVPVPVCSALPAAGSGHSAGAKPREFPSPSPARAGRAQLAQLAQLCCQAQLCPSVLPGPGQLEECPVQGLPSLPALPTSSSCSFIQMCECDQVQKSKLAPERPWGHFLVSLTVVRASVLLSPSHRIALILNCLKKERSVAALKKKVLLILKSGVPFLKKMHV